MKAIPVPAANPKTTDARSIRAHFLGRGSTGT